MDLVVAMLEGVAALALQPLPDPLAEGRALWGVTRNATETLCEAATGLVEAICAQPWPTPPPFAWSSPETSLSHVVIVVGTILAYLGVSFGIRRLMASRGEFKLTGLVVGHNVVLTGWSLVMFVGCVAQILRSYATHYRGDPFGVFCDPKRVVMAGNSDSWMPLIMYSYYLSKFYEMIDTFVIALRKNPLRFLQIYHHSVILLLVWSWQQAGWTLAWFGVALNTLVHVFMYTYFALRALGCTVWWKKYLTTGQLVQFSAVFTLICIEFVYNIVNGWPCSGTLPVVIFSQAVNVSFLYLFYDFYRTTYRKSKAD